MTPEVLARYDRPVPRYTSYPTAPHFHQGVDAEAYRRWLEALEPDAALSLYIHVPFCHSLCWFCGCHTKIVRRHEPVARYFQRLMRELDLVVSRIGTGRPVSQVHLGGGTPTTLGLAELDALGAGLRKQFHLLPETETAVELDPRTVSRAMVRTLAELGVNRASLGVQDLDPGVQQAVNRLQPLAQIRDCMNWLRGEGIDAINVDLMYGLPRQTEHGVRETAERIVALEPERVAVFGYAHVPWIKRHQRVIDESTLPTPTERLGQSEAIASVLIAAGYVPIGLDHFARPSSGLARAQRSGRLRRNFQGYTTDCAPCLLGFGASAIGALPQGYVQNAAPLPEYIAAVDAGRLPIVRGVELDGDDRVRAAVIERLMCDFEVDLGAACETHGLPVDYFHAERPALEDMAADGLVELDGSTIRVTEQARPWVRSVSAVFDRYLETGRGRHAAAV